MESVSWFKMNTVIEYYWLICSSNGNMTWGIIFSQWVNLKLTPRFHALLIMTILSLQRVTAEVRQSILWDWCTKSRSHFPLLSASLRSKVVICPLKINYAYCLKTDINVSAELYKSHVIQTNACDRLYFIIFFRFSLKVFGSYITHFKKNGIAYLYRLRIE